MGSDTLDPIHSCQAKASSGRLFSCGPSPRPSARRPGEGESGNGDIPFSLRWLPYFTLGLSHKLFGPDMPGYRLPSLLLHAGVAIALYAFLRQLWRAILPAQQAGRLSYSGIAFFAALIFALHPVA